MGSRMPTRGQELRLCKFAASHLVVSGIAPGMVPAITPVFSVKLPKNRQAQRRDLGEYPQTKLLSPTRYDPSCNVVFPGAMSPDITYAPAHGRHWGYRDEPSRDLALETWPG